MHVFIVCVCVCVCAGVRESVCVCVCTYVYMCVHIYDECILMSLSGLLQDEAPWNNLLLSLFIIGRTGRKASLNSLKPLGRTTKVFTTLRLG